MDDSRFEQACAWLNQQLDVKFEVALLAGDASFRRYFRVHSDEESWVLMDAPVEKEDTTAFLQTRQWLEQAGIRVPSLIAQDQALGFLLLEDFGDITWAVGLEQGLPIEPMLESALQHLTVLQKSSPSCELPQFGLKRMQAECDLYLDWYFPYMLNIQLSECERKLFHQAIAPCLQRLQALPQVPVHLDYHSRNLMVPKAGLPLGVIDFQDAVHGPITYDLASLLYDCYQDYPESIRLEWSQRFFESLNSPQRASFSNFDEWHELLRLSAFQRHIKAMGIFSRLAYRDGKKQFLDEMPLTRKHLLEELEWLDLPDAVVTLLSRD
ncbi:MAG: phosphotransferase [Mariprofundaceae bacterium]